MPIRMVYVEPQILAQANGIIAYRSYHEGASGESEYERPSDAEFWLFDENDPAPENSVEVAEDWAARVSVLDLPGARTDIGWALDCPENLALIQRLLDEGRLTPAAAQRAHDLSHAAGNARSPEDIWAEVLAQPLAGRSQVAEQDTPQASELQGGLAGTDA